METTSAPFILIADDHAVVRDMFSAFVWDRMPAATIDTVSNLDQAWEALERRPDTDLALLDLGMAGMSPDAFESIHSAFPDVKMAIFSAVEDSETICEMFRRGICGYIPKTTPSKIIHHVVQLILAGGQYLPPHILHDLGGKSCLADSCATGRGLSDRQMEVLQLMVKGHSNKEIARATSLAESTVKTHVACIMRWLNVNSRMKAILAASRLGLIDKTD